MAQDYAPPGFVKFTGELDPPNKTAAPAGFVPFDGELDGDGYGLKDFGGDLASVVTKGVMAVPQAAVGLADIVTGGRAGKALEDAGVRFNEANQIADSWKSDALKAQQKEFQDAEGIGGKAVAALSNPGLIASTVAESIPSMFLGGAVAKGAGLAIPALAGRAGLAAAGEGAVMAGSQAENIRQQTADGLLTPGQSALAAATGVAGGAIGALGAKAGKALGVGDVDTMIANGATQGAREGVGLAGRVGRGALAEGVLEELPQSLTETAFGNIALDKPVTEGMDEAAVLGTLSGGLMGGAAGALSRPAKPSQQMGIDPNAGPLSRAAAASVDSQPVPQPLGASITGTAPADLMGRATDPLAAQIAEGRQQAEAGGVVQESPAAASEPVPLEQRSLDELRQAFRSAQDPAIRKTLAAEIRKRREAMPDPLAPVQQQQEIALEPQANKTIKGKTPREKAGAEGAIEELASGVDGFEAVGPKQPSDERAREANFLSNLSNRQSFIDKGLDGLNVDEFAAVQRLMLRSAKDDKVLKAVVELIPVDVVDVLRSQQLTPEMVFHNPSMLKSGGVRGNTNNPVSIPVDAASKIVRAMAGVAAKDLAINKFPHSGGLPVNGGSAGNAVVPTAISSGLLGDDGTVVSSLLGGGASKGGGTRGIAENVRGTNDLGGVPDNGSAALVAIGGNQNSAPNNVAIINEAEQASEEEPQAQAPRTNKLKEARDARRAADELRGTTGASTVAGGDITPSGVESPVADVRSAGRDNDAGTAQPDANGDAGRAVGSAAEGSAALRPEGWRTTAIKAGKVARSLGLDPKGKRLKEIVAEIDAKDAGSGVSAKPVSREQAIRDAWRKEPRTIGKWTPISVEAEGQKADMLVNQKRSGGDKDGALHVVNIRMGKMLKDMEREPIAYTFRLTSDNRLVEEGVPTVATPGQIAAWKGAGFTLDDKTANVQNTPSSTAGTEAKAAPVEASTADRGNAATNGAVPAAGQDAGVRADGVDDLGPDTFAGSIKREMEARAAADERKARARKPSAPAEAQPEDVDSEVYRATSDGAGKFTLESDESTIAGNGDATPRKFASESDALAWAKENGFKTAAPGAGDVQADGVKAEKNAAPDAQAEKPAEDDAFMGVKKDEPRNLVAMHNLTSDNLLYADSIGGIPVPSIGITKIDSPFNGFGEVTLIAPSSMVDPEQGTPVFDRDAWTARFPTMNFKKVKAKVADAFYERMKPADGVGDDGGQFLSQLWEEMRNASVQRPDKIADLFRRYNAPKMLYANELLGKEIKVPMRAANLSSPAAEDKQLQAYWKKNGDRLLALDRELSGFDFSNSPEYKAFMAEVEGAVRRYAIANDKAERADSYVEMFLPDGQLGPGGFNRLRKDFEQVGKKEVDGVKLSEAVRKAVPDDDPAYQRWVKSLVEPLFETPTITVRGREVEPTLENIVDAMTVGATAGAEKSLTFGPGKTAAMLGKRFKSMAEIKADRDRVVSQAQESEGKKATEAILDQYRAKATAFFKGTDWRGNIDTWAANDASMEALAKAGKAGGSNADIRQALVRAGFKSVDQSTVDLASESIKALRNAATDYFEAKPQRAVKLSEFRAAVVPKGVSQEVKDVLTKNGIEVVEYNKKTEGARDAAIQKTARRVDKAAKDILFMGDKAKAQRQGTPVDRAIMDMAGEGREANEILSFIAKSSKSPYRRQLAQKLLATGANPAVSVGGDLGSKDGYKNLALYSRKNHEIQLAPEAAYKAEQIFLHEAIHSATLLALDKKTLFGVQMAKLYESVKEQGLAGEYGMKNVGEFVAEAMSNKEFQKILKDYKAPQKDSEDMSLWERFVSVVRKIIGMKPSDQDALSRALELGVGVMRENMPLRAAKSFRAEDGPAFAGDDANFGIADASPNNAREAVQPVVQLLNDTFKVRGKIHWWHKTVGTPFNLAERVPEFKRVFNSVQDFINSVSFYGAEAAAMAPKIIPKLESWKDLGKSPIKAEDNKAIAGPIFEGTLSYMRDAEGKPVQTDDVGKAGIVWTDGELRSKFGLTESQIGLYREFRAATDKSLTDLALSDILQFAGKDAEPIKDTVMGMSLKEGSETVSRYLKSLAEGEDKVRKAMLLDTANSVKDKADKAQSLMDRGYAPLQRFGRHTLYATNDKGEQLFFGMYEDRWAAARAARQMREQYPGATVEVGMMSEQSYKMFQGISPETLELFGTMLGLDPQADGQTNEAFQTYLKLAKSNRSALKRLIERKGISGYSEDASRVLASFIYSNARQTASNLHVGEIMNGVNDIPRNMGEAKDAAVKLARYTMDPQEEAQAIRGLLFAQYLGGSIASAAINALQPAQVTFPYLSQFVGAKRSAVLMGGAVKDALKKTTGDAKLDAELKKAEEEGIVSPQEIFQLMAQAQGKATLKAGDGTTAGDAAATASNTLARLSLGWGKVFSIPEQFNRRTTFIAAYRTAKETGEANPYEFAKQAVKETQLVYNKGNRPEWARGTIGALAFTFKTYSISYVELLQRMAASGPEGRRAALLMVGVLFLMAGAGGLPGVEDAEDVIDGIAQRVFGLNFQTRQKRQEWLADTFGEGGARFIENGLSGLPWSPTDVSGRLGLGNLIPGTGVFVKKQDYGRDVAELAGPAADMTKRFLEGAGLLLQGEFLKAGEIVSPTAVRNMIQGGRMLATDQYTDTKGRKVIDTTPAEGITKLIGFQPADVARVQEATGTMQRMIALNKIRESEIADKWAKGLASGDAEQVQEARDELRKWNESNPESPIRINMPQLFRRVRSLKEDKATRIARTAPKEIRQDVRRALEQGQ